MSRTLQLVIRRGLLTVVFYLICFVLTQDHLRLYLQHLSVERAAACNESYTTTLIPLAVEVESNASRIPFALEADRISGATTTNTTRNKNRTSVTTAWCVLDKNNTNPHFKHFPHTMESLSKCWSYFCRVRERLEKQQHQDDHQATLTCGFYVKSPLDWSIVSPWALQLVQRMGCRVVTEPPPLSDFSEYLVLHPRIPHWFEHPGDAQLLKQVVLRRSDNRSRKRPRDLVQIGIVQRNRRHPEIPNRSFLNAKDIQLALQTAFPFAKISMTDMAGWTMPHQAAYWNDQDIIVTAHGAAMSNTIFMHNNNSTVIEIYPDDYTPGMFQRMLQTCGSGVKHVMVQRNTSATPRHRGHPRDVDLAPNVSLILDLVRAALQD